MNSFWIVLAMKNTNPTSHYLVAMGRRDKIAADRDAYVGDPYFVHVPWPGMINDAYDAKRAELIGDHAPAKGYAAGDPPGAEARGKEMPCTSARNVKRKTASGSKRAVFAIALLVTGASSARSVHSRKLS